MSESESKTALVKADLVDKVYERIGFTRLEAVEAVEILFDQIKSVLGSGESVKIAGFASFYLKEKKAREARNPRTGEPVQIKSRRVLIFKPSKKLLLSTNKSFNDSGNS